METFDEIHARLAPMHGYAAAETSAVAMITRCAGHQPVDAAYPGRLDGLTSDEAAPPSAGEYVTEERMGNPDAVPLASEVYGG